MVVNVDAPRLELQKGPALSCQSFALDAFALHIKKRWGACCSFESDFEGAVAAKAHWLNHGASLVADDGVGEIGEGFELRCTAQTIDMLRGRGTGRVSCPSDNTCSSMGAVDDRIPLKVDVCWLRHRRSNAVCSSIERGSNRGSPIFSCL